MSRVWRICAPLVKRMKIINVRKKSVVWQSLPGNKILNCWRQTFLGQVPDWNALYWTIWNPVLLPVKNELVEFLSIEVICNVTEGGCRILIAINQINSIKGYLYTKHFLKILRTFMAYYILGIVPSLIYLWFPNANELLGGSDCT